MAGLWRVPAAMAFGLVMTSPALADIVCPPAPDPMTRLSFESRYADGDASRSTLDEEAEADAIESLAPLDAFLRELARDVGAMLEAEPTESAAHATCILSRMATWAEADALSDQGTETVALTIGSRLASLALMAREARRYSPWQGDLAEVTRWLGRRVDEQMTFWETAPEGASRGNLRAWAALAGAAQADLSGDPVVRGWAAWSTAYVLCSADPDGSLPQEMSRGRLALHYQLHAVAPLVSAVLVLEEQGVSLRERCANALDRIAAFTLDDLATGQATRAITGAEQSLFDGSSELRDFQLAWLEPYVRLTGDRRADRIAAPRRPLSYSKLGGNQTLIWSR